MKVTINRKSEEFLYVFKTFIYCISTLFAHLNIKLKTSHKYTSSLKWTDQSILLNT